MTLSYRYGADPERAARGIARLIDEGKAAHLARLVEEARRAVEEGRACRLDDPAAAAYHRAQLTRRPRYRHGRGPDAR